MRLIAFLMLSAVGLAAQSGAYHWVQLSIRGAGSTLDVRNGGGTLGLSGNRAVFTGKSMGAAFASVGVFENGRLSNALVAGQTLEIRANADASVLVGSSASPASRGETFDLFIAVRQGASAPLAGAYSAAYFGVNGGTASGLVSAMMDFNAGPNSWNNVSLIGHAAARDDVNREESPAGVSYSQSADGRGVARFPPGSDYLAGDVELMVSADSAWMIGYSRSSDSRDILIGHRHGPGRTGASFEGLYWISELTAEEPFAFDASRVRWSAATGTVRADGVSRAEIAEQVVRQKITGTANTWLSTANAYYADGLTNRAALVPALTFERRRNNLHFSAEGLIGAQVGAPGEVTLEHGIFAGVKASSPPGEGAVRLSAQGVVNGASFAPGPVSTLSYVALFGTGLASTTAAAAGYPLPTELAGTRVLVNGQPAPLHSVSAGQINFQFPAVNGAAATVQVSTAAGVSNSAAVNVTDASPGIFSGAVLHSNYSPVTRTTPARPGETLLVFATGLGPVNPPVEPGAPAGTAALSRTTDPNVRAYIAGSPAIVEFSGLAPGFAGLYQLNVRVPDDAVPAEAAPLAISLSSAFTDLAEIVISN